MLKGKWKLLICGLLIVCIGFMVSNNVFAAINKEYFQSYVEGKQVSDPSLNKKISSSVILDALGILIYAVASLLERMLGWLFNLMTGSDLFPWADAILFNAVPFLDINIFTPSSGSLVGLLKNFLSNTYFSLLSMATIFFGIAVSLSAIKMAITAIAEDKAKYKKAIVDLLLGMVLLYGIHFMMSFAIYLNEQLVYTASTIATNQMEANSDLTLVEYDDDLAEKVVNRFINSAEKTNFLDIVMEGSNIVINPIGNLISKLTTKETIVGHIQSWLISTRSAQRGELMNVEEAKTFLRQNTRSVANLLNNDAFLEYCLGKRSWWKPDASTNTSWFDAGLTSKASIQLVATAAKELLDSDATVEYFQNLYEGKTGNLDCTDTNKEFSEKEQIRCNYYKLGMEYVDKGSDAVNNYNVISNLASFFKETAWIVGDNSWKADTVSLPIAIMYAILVSQSLIFFISYSKRLFYIIMLVLMAPIVVVFDYMMKFKKGGGALSSWAKEFLQLVFIQTLQAFIYAIVIGFIINVLKQDYSKALSITEKNTSIGIICVVALGGIFKVEQLARNIFGFGKTHADSGSAIRSIAKLRFASEIGKRVLDNGKKITGGIKMAHGAKKDMSKLDEKFDRKKARLDKMYGKGGNSANISTPSTRLLDGNNVQSGINGNNGEVGVEAQNVDQTSQISNTIVPIVKNDTSYSDRDIAYEEKLEKAREDYETKRKELVKNRKQGYKTMVSGVTEFGGSLIGGTAGGVLGSGTGGLDDITSGVLSGAGIGDWVGEKAVNLASIPAEAGSAIADNLRKKAKAAEKEIERQNDRTAKALSDAIDDKVAQAKRNANSTVKNVNNSYSSESTNVTTSNSKKTTSNVATRTLNEVANNVNLMDNKDNKSNGSTSVDDI